MKLKIKEGTTSKLLKIFVQDSSETDGSGLTGVTHASSGLKWYWIAEGDASPTAVTAVTGTVGTYTSASFKEVDATNMPGVYEIGIPNAAIDATSEGSVAMMLHGVADMAPVTIELELDAIDYRSGVVVSDVRQLIGTAITESTGGRIAGNFDTFFENGDSATTKTVSDVGTAVVSGEVTANLTKILGTTIVESSAGNIAANFDEFFDADDSLSTKTVSDVGTAVVSGEVTANLTKILGTTIVESSSGNIAANFDEFFDADDSLTTKTVSDVGTTTNTVNASLTEVLGTPLTETTTGRIAGNFDTFFENGNSATAKKVDDVGTSSIAGTIDANVTQILGTAIAETSSGNLAANFDEFFDADDSLTTKTVSDVGTGTEVTANLTKILGTAIVESSSGNIAANFDEFFDADDSLTTKTVSDIGGNAGHGAYTVTITIDDGSSGALENATVRLSEGTNAYTATTNASGVATFVLDAASYTANVTKTGYNGHTATLAVSGTTSQTYSLTTNTISAPAAAGLSTGVMTVLDESGTAEVGVPINFQIIAGKGVAGHALDSKAFTVTSAAAGYVEYTGFIQGVQYQVWRGPSPSGAGSGLSVSGAGQKVKFTVPAAASFNIAEVIGADAE